MPSGVVRQKQEVLTTGGFGGNGGNGGNGGTGRGPQGEVLLGGPGVGRIDFDFFLKIIKQK